ncbi:MAG: asparagine synthase (glutamine-hydrolyzing) [Oscillospiraceae bacterium]|nr:asparagine synthase (glutamine-hydrolyzing) [Oscillospiraceae bacterium]
MHEIILFDGELYNLKELKHELELSGHKFNENSNIEIIKHSYTEWREECVKKFNGVFAFAILENNNKLFCARDRIGVKPFFYTIQDNNFICASEIKTLLKNSKIPTEIDSQAIAEIILIGPGRTPGYGIFKNISELEPASFGIFENGEFKKYKYWDMKDGEHIDNFAQTAEKVRYLVIDSIERQFISDKNKKVCTMLSGGLDSSLITSVTAKYFKEQKQKLYSFSVDYKDNFKYFSANKFQPNSDGEYIERMKDYLKSEYFEHYQIILDTQNLIDALYAAVDARDLPGMADVDASLLLFCKEIKKFADIALSGESADEIFGGYPWYRDKEIRDNYGFPWSQSTDFRKTFFKDDFNFPGLNNYVSEKYNKAINDSDVSKTANQEEKRIKELVNLNIKWFMQTLLERQNRMSSYSEFTIRAPYCDYRIVEYLYNIPWEYKDYNNTEKGLLRYAMRGLLPDEVSWRKKNPYPKTHNPEYLNAVSKILTEIINEPSSPLLKIIKKESLEYLIKSNSSVPWYGQLMTTPQTIAYFIQINYWLEKYKINIV